MIGNDIVDLNLAESESNWKRRGFLEKLFTDYEKELILSSKRPFIEVWRLWSMKESAYKCFVKQFNKRLFNPKRFECSIESSKNGIVSFKNKVYYTKTKTTNSFIHTVALKDKNLEFEYNLHKLENNHNSNELNSYLMNQFSQDVKIKKNDFGVPFLFKYNIKLPLSISISHHGNYGGYVISGIK